MKRKLHLWLFFGLVAFMFNTAAFAQGDSTTKKEETQQVTTEQPAKTATTAEEKSFHQVMKEKFIEGDPLWMAPVLLCLILGLAIAIERIIALNLSSTNTEKLLENVKGALETGGVQAAKDLTAATKGPTASIFTQGLMRMSEGMDMVEKAVVSYGSVEMSKLERGLIWISLFIGLAPMLGFMGTVVGMIQAFDAIEAAGDISPSLVAGGIKVALLTTVAGLIVAIVLQIFYNYCVSKIDSVVGEMEEASIALVDLLVDYQLKKK